MNSKSRILAVSALAAVAASAMATSAAASNPTPQPSVPMKSRRPIMMAVPKRRLIVRFAIAASQIHLSDRTADPIASPNICGASATLTSGMAALRRVRTVRLTSHGATRHDCLRMSRPVIRS